MCCVETLDFISGCLSARFPPAGLTPVWLGRWEGGCDSSSVTPAVTLPGGGTRMEVFADGRRVRLENR